MILQKSNIKHKAITLCVGFVLGFAISPLSYSIYSLFVPTPGNTVALNSDTINQVAKACDLLHRNSDLIGRFSHYILPHPPNIVTMLCPECSGAAEHQDDTVLPAPVDDSKTKLSHVHADSQEVNGGVRRIVQSLSIQYHTLKMNLDRLREK